MSKRVTYEFEHTDASGKFLGTSQVQVLETTTEAGARHRLNVELRQWLKDQPVAGGSTIYVHRHEETQ